MAVEITSRNTMISLTNKRNGATHSSITSIRLLALVTFYFASILNISLWRYFFQNIEIKNFSVLIFSFSVPALIFCALLIIFTLTCWPRLTKPLLFLLLPASSMAAYFMFQYGVFIDSDMIRNILQTNTREALDLLSIKYLLWVLVTGILPLWMLARTKIVYAPPLKECKTRGLLILAAALACSALFGISYKDYVSWGRNNKNVVRLINPTNYIYATIRYFIKLNKSQMPFVTLDKEVRHAPYPDADVTVFVLIIGETARAMNFSLNGYEKETNPKLSGQNIVNYKDVTAAGTATAISVPRIFSSLPNGDINQIHHTENLLDLLQNAGYDILWLENDDGCKEVCKRVPTIDMVVQNNPKYCDGSYCLDGVLLENLNEHLQTITKDTFIILHTMGSHGPTYYKRYPPEFKKFEPTCDTKDIQGCPREAIVNTYDNTILYTDHIVSGAIDILKKYPQLEAGLLYVSDHGESLGENGIYLHALPYSIAPKEQIKVPMVLWMSELMKKEDHLDYECLKSKASLPHAHDNLFHSLIGLMEVKSTTYRQELDMFEACRQIPLPK